MKLEDCLMGHWTNKHQAQSDPTNWVTVEIIWKSHEKGFQSMNFKRCDGPGNPYRKKNHKFLYLSDREVVVENYHLDWTRHEDCDILFTSTVKVGTVKLLVTTVLDIKEIKLSLKSMLTETNYILVTEV